MPGGPIFGHFDRLQGGTDLRILGPILASAEISEELPFYADFSEIFASGGREPSPHPTLVTCIIKLLETM